MRCVRVCVLLILYTVYYQIKSAQNNTLHVYFVFWAQALLKSKLELENINN